MRRTTCFLLAISFLLLVSPVRSQTVEPIEFEVETYVEGLDSPVAFDFIGPEDLLVLERATGKVVRVTDRGVARVVLDLDVADDGTRGGLGLTLDPDFEANGAVYIFYSVADEAGGDWVENRLVRATFNGNRLVKPKTLLAFPRDPDQANDSDQNGGTLRFGPDGMLYGQVGSLGRGVSDARGEQNGAGGMVSGVGGIFRVQPNGDVPDDNPFADASDPGLHKWFAYGVRDGSGIAFDPVTGALWFTDQGPGMYDEVNYALPGMNSGWRRIVGPDKRDAAFDANDNTPADERDLLEIPGSEYADPAFSAAESSM